MSSCFAALSTSAFSTLASGIAPRSPLHPAAAAGVRSPDFRRRSSAMAALCLSKPRRERQTRGDPRFLAQGRPQLERISGSAPVSCRLAVLSWPHPLGVRTAPAISDRLRTVDRDTICRHDFRSTTTRAEARESHSPGQTPKSLGYPGPKPQDCLPDSSASVRLRTTGQSLQVQLDARSLRR